MKLQDLLKPFFFLHQPKVTWFSTTEETDFKNEVLCYQPFVHVPTDCRSVVKIETEIKVIFRVINTLCLKLILKNNNKQTGQIFYRTVICNTDFF